MLETLQLALGHHLTSEDLKRTFFMKQKHIASEVYFYKISLSIHRNLSIFNFFYRMNAQKMHVITIKHLNDT